MIEKKYGDLNGTIAMVELTKGLTGLGLSLVGNKDRKKMSVFVCGMHPKGSAFKDGRIQVGDEILEVSPIFSLPSRSLPILILTFLRDSLSLSLTVLSFRYFSPTLFLSFFLSSFPLQPREWH